jgi:hypothetical protein
MKQSQFEECFDLTLDDCIVRDQTKPPSGEFRIGRWMTILFIFLAVLTVYYSDKKSEGFHELNSSNVNTIANEELERKIAALLKRADDSRQGRNGQAYQKYEQELLTTQKLFTTHSPSPVAISEKLTEVGMSFKISYAMALDLVTDGDRADKLLSQELYPFINATNDAMRRQTLAYEQLRTDLLTSAESFNNELAGGLTIISQESTFAEQSAAIYRQSITDNMNKFQESAKETSITLIFSGVSIKAIIDRLRSGGLTAFSKVAKAAAKRLGFAGLAAATDGPLPFGDAAAFTLESAFLVWTTVDLYDARVTVREALENQFIEETESFSKSLVENGRADGINLMAEFNKMAAETINIVRR